MVAHLGEEGVATGDDERDERERGLGLRGLVLTRVEQPGGVDVALEMIDPDQRLVVTQASAFAKLIPTSSDPAKPGP